MPNQIEENVIRKLNDSRILVIGDLILDHYAFGSVNRISPEAPIQIFDFEREEFRLGGAANVSHNIVKLGAKSDLIGVIGNDLHGEVLKHLAKDVGIGSIGIIGDTDRPTTTKTRFICQGHHLLRTDKEKRHSIAHFLQEKLLSVVQSNIQKYQGIIISDYAKGVLTEELCTKIIAFANQHHVKVMVGPKGKDWKKYSHAYVLSANRSETEAVVGTPLKTMQDIAQAGKHLMDEFHLQAMLITLGAEGMYLVVKGEQDFYLPTQALEVFDVVGAGDTVLSVMSLVLASGYEWKTAVKMANVAAGIVVGKVGVAVVHPEELLARFLSSEPSLSFKESATTSN